MSLSIACNLHQPLLDQSCFSNSSKESVAWDDKHLLLVRYLSTVSHLKGPTHFRWWPQEYGDDIPTLTFITKWRKENVELCTGSHSLLLCVIYSHRTNWRKSHSRTHTERETGESWKWEGKWNLQTMLQLPQRSRVCMGRDGCNAQLVLVAVDWSEESCGNQ